MAGIYIHIPFCKQACYYCDFHFSTSLKYKEGMVKALVHELELRKEELNGHLVETIYFGGGTPSLLTVPEAQLLIDTIYSHYKVTENPEITLEANPDDLTIQRIQEYSNTQINRLSIGIQSFFDRDLELMNRAHNAAEAKACLQEAGRYFGNITIDLIYGIPGLTDERWKENLQTAFDAGINHISSYALTVEPHTALADFIRKGKYPQVSEEQAASQFMILKEQTERAGFIHYELSNFGKPGYFSKHNTAYWQGKSYLGIGPSAHSYNGVQRSWNVANNVKYIKAIERGQLCNEVEQLAVKEQFNEMIMTGLRTMWGVSLNEIEVRFGVPVKAELLQNAQKFIDQGLLVIAVDPVQDDRTNGSSCILKLTQKGLFLSDGIASELFMID